MHAGMWWTSVDTFTQQREGAKQGKWAVSNVTTSKERGVQADHQRRNLWTPLAACRCLKYYCVLKYISMNWEGEKRKPPDHQRLYFVRREESRFPSKGPFEANQTIVQQGNRSLQKSSLACFAADWSMTKFCQLESMLPVSGCYGTTLQKLGCDSIRPGLGWIAD